MFLGLNHRISERQALEQYVSEKILNANFLKQVLCVGVKNKQKRLFHNRVYSGEKFLKIDNQADNSTQ